MTATAPKYRVLVVDDNQDAATSVSELLDLAGFEVRTYFSGASALAGLGGFVPDACVLDIAMPGMDGYELARKLRERFPDRPPVFATLTAFDHDTHLEKAVDAGFDLQFTKPAPPMEVIKQLREALQATPPPEDPAKPGREGVLQSLLGRLKGLFTHKGKAK